MMRIDMLIKERFGLSRQKAQQLIKEGAVRVDGKIVDKPSLAADENGVIEILENDVLKYAGRGGLKLEAAIKAFGLELKDKICIDIGASTGGFTDCMLQNGARRVYAVDVGTAQLAEKLLSDDRVVCCENTDIRAFECPEKADFAAADVSFVSLEKILPEIDRLLCGEYAAVLVKPQFEAGREHLNKNGIVRDTRVHKKVLERTAASAAGYGLYCGGVDVSPIKGGDGNTEYLMLLCRKNNAFDTAAEIKKAVEKAGKR